VFGKEAYTDEVAGRVTTKKDRKKILENMSFGGGVGAQSGFRRHLLHLNAAA